MKKVILIMASIILAFNIANAQVSTDKLTEIITEETPKIAQVITACATNLLKPVFMCLGACIPELIQSVMEVSPFAFITGACGCILGLGICSIPFGIIAYLLGMALETPRKPSYAESHDYKW
jgi:hypothetical protein